MDQTLTQELIFISPLLVLALGSFVLLLVDVFFGDGTPRELITFITLVAALCCCVPALSLSSPGSTILQNMIFAGFFSWFAMVLIIGAATLCALLIFGSLDGEGIEAPGEFYSLYLMTTAGALLFALAAEFISLFLGLEIMSMAAYVLAGSATSKDKSFLERVSAEASLKYFLLGSFSSAFLLYGIALIYGLSGTTVIPEVGMMVTTGELAPSSVLFLSIGLLAVGLLFKIGAVPFHFWTPDVYQGSPTGVTAFMASVIKSASVLTTLRILWVGFGTGTGGYIPDIWIGGLWTVSALTMIVGNAIAVRQLNVKRMLAYSSIAHVGYMLMALLLPGEGEGAAASVLFYLVGYCVMTLGSFGVLLSLEAKEDAPQQQFLLQRFRGMGHTRPVLAAFMSLFLLSLAGLPPGLVGLLGKFYLFAEVVRADYIGLAIIGVACSAVSCYYYLRVIVAMYFYQPDSEGEVMSARPRLGLSFVLATCGVAVIFLGIFPSGLYAIALEVSQGLIP